MSFVFDPTLEQGLLAAGLGLLLADQHTHLVGYNRAAAKMLHLSELNLGHPLTNTQGSALPLAFKQALKTQQAINTTLKLPGKVEEYLCNITPFYPVDSNSPMLLITVSLKLSTHTPVKETPTHRGLGAAPALVAFESLPATQTLALLVVDDDEDSRYLMRNNLQASKTWQYSITEADSAEQALAKLKQQHFDVCITDYRLLDETALELFDQARQLDLSPPFIVVSNYPEETLYSQLQGTGIADVISKAELTPELIQRSIRYAVQKHQLAQILQAGASGLN